MVLHVDEDGWGDEISLFSMSCSSMDESSALRFSSFNIRQYSFVLLFSDLRTLEGVFGKRISNNRDFCGFLFECFDKLELWVIVLGIELFPLTGQESYLIVDTLLYEYSGGGSANLAHVTHNAQVSPLDSLF